jgi:hypothetical protein
MSSRYERDRSIGSRELDEARALHMIGRLVGEYPGITDSTVAAQVAQVLHAAANELGNGRPLPIELRRSVLALANALRADMQPADGLDATP